jgi:hypothetical protein
MKLRLKMSLIPMCLLVISCTTNNQESLNSIKETMDSIKPAEIESWKLIYDVDNLKIEANSDIDESMIQSVQVKFEPYIWFEDFPAKTIDTVSKAPLDFSTNREAKWYITAIRNGYKEERSAFGGHYELIIWGCGSPCYHGVIVDRKNGQMIHLPESLTGYNYQDNSLMLIVNPTDKDGFYDLKHEHGIYAPLIYVFDEVKKEFKLLGPKGR